MKFRKKSICECGAKMALDALRCADCHHAKLRETAKEKSDLAAEIRAWLASSGTTVSDFTDAVGCSRSAISQLDSGIGSPELMDRMRRVMKGETFERPPSPSDEIERARRMSELAKETKGPGQTIHARLKELRREMAA